MKHPVCEYIDTLPAPPRDTITLRLLVNPREIAYLSGIFEAYPGFAMIRTDDAKTGEIRLWIAPDFYQETMDILAGLKEELIIRELPPDGEPDES